MNQVEDQEINPSEEPTDAFSRNMGCGFMFFVLLLTTIGVIFGFIFRTDSLEDAPLFFFSTIGMLAAALIGISYFKIDSRNLFGSVESFTENISYSILVIPLLFCSIGIMFGQMLLVYGLFPDGLGGFIDRMDGFELGLGDSTTALVMMFFAVVIIGPIAEEILFRGILFSRWSRIYSPAKAAFYSSILFGVLHANAIGLFFVGWMLCMIYMYTKSLWIPIVIHILNNLVAVIFYQRDYFFGGDLSSEWVSQNMPLLFTWVVITIALIYTLVKNYSPATETTLPYDSN